MDRKYKYNAYRRQSNRETLERIKRWPALMKRFSHVRIYSAEHGAFWRGTGQGYTDDVEASDVLTMEEAYKMTNYCCPMKRIQYVEATPPEVKP